MSGHDWVGSQGDAPPDGHQMLRADLPAEDVRALAEAKCVCGHSAWRHDDGGCKRGWPDACYCAVVPIAALAPTVALIRDRHAAALEARVAAVEALAERPWEVVDKVAGITRPGPIGPSIHSTSRNGTLPVVSWADLRAALHPDPPNPSERTDS